MAESILYINACVRKASRTALLAEKLLSKLGGSVTELRLETCAFPALNEAYLKRRDQLLLAGDLQDPMFALARQFALADTIVIAAPYWDLSFPAALKQYLEQINVVGITFKYTPEGAPIGLCRAKRLFYVTTAGGAFVPEAFGFGYVKALAQNFYGIQNVQKAEATGLDIGGADAEAIMERAMESLSRMELN